MELNQEWLTKARSRQKDFLDVGSKYALTAAIETYLAEMFKPGQVQMLEPLEVIPQRDYRKELWIAAYLENGRTRDAHIALEGFDQAFPKENHHG